MATTKFKKKRLFRVSRELNVSVDTIVEHLEGSGFADALQGNGINASITDEDAYLDLLEAFAADQAMAQRVKEKRAARMAEIGGDDPEVVSIDTAVADPPTPESVAPVEEPTDVVVPEPELVAEVVTPVPEAVEPTVQDEAIAAQIIDPPVADSPPEAPLVEPEVLPDPVEPSIAEAQAPTVEVSTAEVAEAVVEEAAEAEAADVVATTETVTAADAVVAPEPIVNVAAEPKGEPEKPVKAKKAKSKSKSKAKAKAPVVEAVDPVEAIAPVEAAAPVEPVKAVVGDTGEAGEDEESLLTADRYQLAGTKVLGKIDLGGVDDEGRGRRRKRKRKRKTEPEKAEKPVAKKAAEKPAKETKKKRVKKKRGPAVDEADVQQTLQETLRELEQGASRVRQRRRRQRRDERAEERRRKMEQMEEMDNIIRLTEFISTGELANLMDVDVNDVIKTLFSAGMMVSINQRLDADTITIVADEFGYDVEFITDFSAIDIEIEEDAPEDLEWRAPVVTVMGHVDHGKTSLLDYIRSASVADGEAGGITQHIGAYNVSLKDDRVITFLDTPGHEAFTAMRARGAQVTDIVILVVAADDSVMPQTIEAINHAGAADVPLVVAINKIDKQNANPDKVMQQLTEHNVIVEQFGGKVQTQQVSAKTGEGIDDLLDKVLMEAELKELKANPHRTAVGTVIESRLEKGRGNVATVLVQNGTLRVGDSFVAGIHSGRVRAMFDERERRVDEVGPSKPALVLGFDGAPDVGDQFIGLDDEREARNIAQRRQQIYREQSLRQRKHITLDEIGRRLALGDFQELNLIIKGDVSGSVEALSDSLLKLSTEEVQLNIIHRGVGAITESDVMLASASDAVIIGFQVRPMANARALAEREEIDVRTYSVIYNAIEDVHDALEGLLSPEETEKILGVADVREIFKVPKVGTIAGCFVSTGKIRRSDRVHLIRDSVVIYDGHLSSLKRFKDDVREVQNGYECGMGIENFNDIKVGDQIEAFEIIETARKLEI